jgi:hypothetical protein
VRRRACRTFDLSRRGPYGRDYYKDRPPPRVTTVKKTTKIRWALGLAGATLTATALMGVLPFVGWPGALLTVLALGMDFGGGE